MTIFTAGCLFLVITCSSCWNNSVIFGSMFLFVLCSPLFWCNKLPECQRLCSSDDKAAAQNLCWICVFCVLDHVWGIWIKFKTSPLRNFLNVPTSSPCLLVSLYFSIWCTVKASCCYCTYVFSGFVSSATWLPLPSGLFCVCFCVLSVLLRRESLQRVSLTGFWRTENQMKCLTLKIQKPQRQKNNSTESSNCLFFVNLRLNELQ